MSEKGIDTGRVLASLMLLLLMAGSAWSQKRGDGTVAGTAASRRESMLMREEDLRNRELRLRLLREPTKSASSPEKNQKVLLDQIFEDFERLQIKSGEIVRACAGDALDYKRISNTAEEIGRRAKRLKTNLAIPDSPDGSKDLKQVAPLDDKDVRKAVQNLDRLIKSFVTNPLFQDPRVTDVQQLTKARGDLEDIISVSHILKKSAQKLNRS